MNELVRDWKAEKKDLEEAFDIIADKLVKAAAEIERLKAEIKDQMALIEDNKQLITKLASVVHSAQVLMGWNSYDNLLQRAREATK